MAGRISPQAQSLVHALKLVGLARRDFIVRTESAIEEGHRIWGNARATIFGRPAVERVAAHAEELADRNLTVTLVTNNDGAELLTVLVDSRWNGAKEVGRLDLKQRQRDIDAFNAACEESFGEPVS